MLNNPIWHSLATAQRAFGEGNHLARRFTPDVAPFGAISEPSETAYDALAQVVPAGSVTVLFLENEPLPPAAWTLLHTVRLHQMVYPPTSRNQPRGEHRILTRADVPSMSALVDLTEPGPFRPRTSELGTYLGIDRSERLVAMAGERLRLDGFTEISAVCTHPDHRGQGYAGLLVSALIGRILDRGEVPFLHVRADNTAAIALYSKLGFNIRAPLHVAVLRREAL